MLPNLQVGISDIFQIAILVVAIYYILVFFRGTRGAQVLMGLTVLTLVAIVMDQFLYMEVLSWILRKLSVYLALGLLVIFQPEIRRALAELGRQPVFTASAEKRTTIDHLVLAVEELSQRRIGALVAIEREIGTRTYEDTGTRVDAPMVPELLQTIFYPHTPLHDGGVIIRGNRIVAAGCVFPLSHRSDLLRTLGTRHRAAVGLSEETDAVVVVVSEETGVISIAYRGRLIRDLDHERLRRFLSALLLRGRRRATAWSRMREQLDLTPEGIARSETRKGEEGARDE